MLYNKIRKNWFTVQCYMIYSPMSTFFKICDLGSIWHFVWNKSHTNGKICGEKITNHFEIILWHWKAALEKQQICTSDSNDQNFIFPPVDIHIHLWMSSLLLVCWQHSLYCERREAPSGLKCLWGVISENRSPLTAPLATLSSIAGLSEAVTTREKTGSNMEKMKE